MESGMKKSGFLLTNPAKRHKIIDGHSRKMLKCRLI